MIGILALRMVALVVLGCTWRCAFLWALNVLDRKVFQRLEGDLVLLSPVVHLLARAAIHARTIHKNNLTLVCRRWHNIFFFYMVCFL